MITTTKPTPGQKLSRHVEALDSSVDHLACLADHDDLTGEQLYEALKATEAPLRKLQAVTAKLAGALADQQARRGRSTGATAKGIAGGLGVCSSDARSRIDAGRRCHTLGGTAHAQGRITDRQERMIGSIMDKVGERVSDVDRADLEAELVAFACKAATPRQLNSLARRRLHVIDPEFADRADERQQRERSVVRGAVGTDGLASVGITCEPRMRALLDAVIAKFGRPGRCIALGADPATGQLPDASAAEAAAANDTRSPAQRAYDALCHVLALGLADAVPTPRGLASMLVRVTPDELDDPRALVTTDAGTDLTVAQAISLAGSAPWFLTSIRDGEAELHAIDVDAGAGRLFTRIQRMWLFSSWGGCTFPGCDAPAATCHGDHVDEHARGGPTTVANANSACPPDHGQKGDLPHQWSCVNVPGRPGKPRWIPPTTSRFA